MPTNTAPELIKFPQIAFIGTGTMGRPMVERFFDAGLDPIIHDAFKDSAKPLLERGFRWADNLAELASQASIVFLSLPGPPQVEAVVSGANGLLASLKPGSIIIDLSTNSVPMVRSLHDKCAEKGIGFLDSPVSGGSKGSQDGTLVLMVGGEEQLLNDVRPLLDILSREIVYLGESGAGTVAKLVNNQLYLCGEVIFYEGLVLASKANLDIDALINILNKSGAGGIHSKVADRILERHFDDNTFALNLAEKDVALSLEAGRALDVPMPATSAAHQLFVEAKAAGMGNKNFWNAIELAEQHANTRIKD